MSYLSTVEQRVTVNNLTTVVVEQQLINDEVLLPEPTKRTAYSSKMPDILRKNWILSTDFHEGPQYLLSRK
jgi:hypothetical protein